VGHHIYINLQNGRVYCLPDNYEVVDVSFRDIQYNLSPFYEKSDLEDLDNNPRFRRALNGKEYLPGFVGLNNL
jgi:U4/U6.U5 tri-snRNP-associated protein 2